MLCYRVLFVLCVLAVSLVPSETVQVSRAPRSDIQSEYIADYIRKINPAADAEKLGGLSRQKVVRRD